MIALLAAGRAHTQVRPYGLAAGRPASAASSLTRTICAQLIPSGPKPANDTARGAVQVAPGRREDDFQKKSRGEHWLAP